MFCYQCEQTVKGTGCTISGVCGKDEKAAALQDLLVYAIEGIANYAHRAAKLGFNDAATNHFVIEALFSTVTNVNFDLELLLNMLQKAGAVKDNMRKLYGKAARDKGVSPHLLTGPASWEPAGDLDGLLLQAQDISLKIRSESCGEDVAGLQELILYGLKGMAAYADHAMILGVEDNSVYAFFHEALDFLTRENHSLDAMLSMALKVGEVNLKVMELLDRANTAAYGDPTPVKVRITPLKGKAILVSGHDLKDLEVLLQQTAEKGINIYTHGEMLPAHGYPGLKKYPHLVGNYGGAWQEQRVEFEKFPGAILMTTNCIQKPDATYQHRIFTSGLAAWPGVKHITSRDFAPVIAAALMEPGFMTDEPEKNITTGFARNAVLSVADKVIEAVKKGNIRHFFLIGGCDGAKPGRNYYTEFARQTPPDTVILTLACGKYRFNKLEFGEIVGIPRLLDIGQCNDAYAAIQIALALADAFNTDVNSLPLSLILSWYEQKAVCILLTLLYLGIKNIRLGPSLPAFIKLPVFRILHEKYNLMPITTPDEDLKAILE